MRGSEGNFAAESVGVDGASSSVGVRFTLPEDNTAAAGDDYITLDVGEISAAAHSVKEAGCGAGGPELNPENKSSFRASFTRHPRSFYQAKSGVAQALKDLEYVIKSVGGATWTGVEERFHQLTSTTNGMLPRSLIGVCIGLIKESGKFASELFEALSRRRSISGESITEEQLKEFWDRISGRSFDGRLQIFFDMIDKYADGRITEDEVRQIISMGASANNLSNIQKQADEYARLVMEELDPDNLGYIMIENLEMLLLHGKNQTIESTEGTANKFLGEKIKPEQDHIMKKWYRDFQKFLVDINWQRIWVLAVWIGVMGGLFCYKYMQYKNRAVYRVTGHCVCAAEGAAETLKLNMALILLPMCRSTVAWLRNNTKLGAAVPFDDNVNFHKVIAIAIAVGVVIHGTSHLACDFPRLLNASKEKYAPMEQFFGKQPTSYWLLVKGWEGVTGILMVVLMAIAFTLALPWFRRNTLAGFNALWCSHSLFVLVYALLIIHGIKLFLAQEWYKKTTWMYLAVPILIYAGEKLIRALRPSIQPVKILKVAVYPGDVLVLYMSKPQGFQYKSGQYIFVKSTAVSPLEWHPFSITSAPRDDYLILHFPTLGRWTRKLKLVLSEEQPPTGKSGLLRADFLEGENNPNFSTLLIDGPYGTPTRAYNDYDVVLLIGIGIGATPLISITKDIIGNIKATEDEEDVGFDFKTRRGYLHWVNREQGSFYWLNSVMNEVAGMDRKGVIEIHNYNTGLYEEGGARSALIGMLQMMERTKTGVDIISGTKVMSHFGKPDWMTVYNGIALTHPDSRVGVFYCGAPPLVQELRQLASDFSRNTSTIFEFHKGHF